MHIQILHLLVSIFQFFSVLQALTHPSDISALKSFKTSINPTTIPSWSCLASWNFNSDDPCSLPHRTHFICGLTCDSGAAATATNRITGLTLDPVGYSGTLSPLLSSLSELTHLDLSDNAFHGEIPPSLPSLTKLETLILRSNSFSGNLPPSLTKLTSLQTLDLSHNAFSGLLPATMNSLTSLRILDLSFNKLAGNVPKLPPNLAELALKANFLSGSLLESSFRGLDRLEVVELSANSLTGAVQDWFFLLPSIQQVNLANNSLTGIQISRPGGGNLVAVDLSFNKIDGYLPAEFSSLPSLSSLSLRFNRLHGPIPRQFGNKASLRRLFLDGNFLNGTAPKGFFSNKDAISGSFGDNCLEGCPAASRLCMPPQKPSSVCRQAYGKRPRSLEVGLLM